MGAAAIGYVAWKTWEDRETLVTTWETLDSRGLVLIISAILLVIPNLLLEASKWRIMIRAHYPNVKLFTAVQAVLAGMATGIFTPNRIGEYAGRLLYLEPGHRMEAMVGTFIDRISQLAVTLASGALVLVALTTSDPDFLQQDGGVAFLGNGLLAIALGTLLVIIAFLSFPRQFSRLIPGFLLRFKWVRQLKEGTSTVDRQAVIKVFALSLLRYGVFSSQYVLLLFAMGWSAGIPMAYALVTLVFLAKSVIPVPGIMELGVRETIALKVFALASLAPSAAVQSTFLLYLINIVLPTLAGIIALRGLRPWGARKEEA